MSRITEPKLSPRSVFYVASAAAAAAAPTLLQGEKAEIRAFTQSLLSAPLSVFTNSSGFYRPLASGLAACICHLRHIKFHWWGSVAMGEGGSEGGCWLQ